MKNLIRFKVGPSIFNQIRDEGLNPKRVRVFAAPAGGPKWFVSVGFDKALIKTKFFEKSSFDRVLLAGASAGAWRCMAMACEKPLSAYEKLRISYSRNIFTSQDTPLSISRKLLENVDSFLTDVDINHILNHPKLDLAIHVVRSKNLAASDNIHAQGLGLILSAVLNVFDSNWLKLFFDKVIFYTGPRKPNFTEYGQQKWTFKLDAQNIRKVALATGSLPYFIKGVSEISGAPHGVYRDGGLINYQLNEDYQPGEGLILFFHYQERISPGWFDKKLPWKKTSEKTLDRVLQIFPSAEFVKMLPDGKIPDRKDFTTFVKSPGERIRRWDKVCQLSELLAEEFMESIESGRIRDRIEPLFP
ncbi:MAG: hypothetical protein ACP5U1_05420 [Desulfomonilaceae bacterium]